MPEQLKNILPEVQGTAQYELLPETNAKGKNSGLLTVHAINNCFIT